MQDTERYRELLKQIKLVSKQYRELTGRPLGCTGEVAEYEAARILGLELAPVRQAGYDAIRDGKVRIQIKGRCLISGTSKNARIGSINTKGEWDSIVLVLLDESLDPVAIYEADRPDVLAALEAPGSRARNVRHALAISQFASIGRMIWPPKATHDA